MPKYSFIIPVYKTEKYLTECIESILAQTYQNFEIILVDDGSPDRCGEICDDYAGRYESIQVIHIKNSGLSVARNTGLKAASGEYIIFLDSDDFWYLADGLERINSALSQDTDILVFPSYNLSDKSGKISADRYSYPAILNTLEPEACLEYMITHDLFNLHAGKRVFRRSFLADNDLWFKPNIRAEDVELGFRVANLLPRYRFLDERLYVYRHREGSITTTMSSQQLYELSDIIKEYAHFSYVNDNVRNLLLSYDAYQLSLLMAHLYKIPRDDQKKIKREMREYRFLFQYRAYPRTKTIAAVHSVIGFSLTQKALSAYLRAR